MKDSTQDAQEHVIRAVQDGGNEKLLGAKQALKDRLMRAVLEQAIHELGEPATIARSVMSTFGAEIKAVPATAQILKQLLIAEIERTTTESLSDARQTADAIYTKVGGQWKEPDAIKDVLRERVLDETAKRAIASLGSSADAAEELLASERVPTSRIEEISQALTDRMVSEASDRTLASLEDQEEVAGSIFRKLGDDHAVIVETSLALEIMIRDEIRRQAEKTLSNQTELAEQVHASLENAPERVRAVAQAIADRIVGDIAAEVTESISDAATLVERASGRVTTRDRAVEAAIASLTDSIVAQIAERAEGDLAQSDAIARRVLDRMDKNREAVSRFTHAAKERVLADVVNSAISELSEDLGTKIDDLPSWARVEDAPEWTPDEEPIPLSAEQEAAEPEPVEPEPVEADGSEPELEASDAEIEPALEAADEAADSDTPVVEASRYEVVEATFDASDDEPSEDLFNAFREESASTSPSRSDDDASGDALYVYGVANGAAASVEWPSEGMDSRHPVRTVEYKGLHAVVSDVDADEYCGETGERNMKDVEWLKERARRHAVLLESMKIGETFVPLRFCTIVNSEDQVHEMLKADYDHYRSAIDRVNGAEEWSLRIHRDINKLNDRVRDSDRQVEDSLGVISQGVVSFVKEEMQRIDKMGGEAIDLITDHCVRRSHAALMECSRDGLKKPVIADETGGDIILSAAYLVDKNAGARIQDEVDRLAGEYEELGFRFELSGPWPPYHFVNAPDAKDQQAVES